MRRNIARRIAFLGLAASSLVTGLPAPASAEPVVRERQSVAVAGETETWILVWDKAPSPFCSAGEISMSDTCPCIGFAYGQAGKLWLIRRRGGQDIDRLDMGSLFRASADDLSDYQPGFSYIQRWPLKVGDLAREERDDPTLMRDIMSRPAPTLMQVANFDHDTDAQEFLIQVATKPCGSLQYSAVGVSAGRPRLHVLSTMDTPDRPLVMPLAAWRALVLGAAPHTLVTWECWDHGSETETDLTVSAAGGAIRVKSTEYSCPTHGGVKQLLKEGYL